MGIIKLWLSVHHGADNAHTLTEKEKWRWYVKDLGIPLISVTLAAGFIRWLIPIPAALIGKFAYLLGTLLLTTVVAILLTPYVRATLMNYIRVLAKFIIPVSLNLANHLNLNLRICDFSRL